MKRLVLILILLASPLWAVQPDEVLDDPTLEARARALSAELRALLSQDIAEQTEGPLQVLRRGVRFATLVLGDAGTPHTPRDDFAQRAFPDDVYNLAPASFAEVHPTLHEPGLIWGAAKAHVHLRRRREAGQA